jgi:Flp pilus assembly protein CpaB
VRRRTVAIIVAVVLALVAAGLVVWYVSSLKGEKAAPVVTRTVVVAIADIPARTTGEAMVANGLVQEKQVDSTAVTPGAVNSLSSLQGMALTVPVASGQQLLKTQLAEPSTQALSFQIKTGMRAITLPIDRNNAVGGAIKEGDRVDVVATFKTDVFQVSGLGLGIALSAAETARIQALTGLDLSKTISPLTVILLQQVEVLAVDALSASSTTATTQVGGVFSNGSSTATTELNRAPVITLQVTPSDAQKLVFAQEYGVVWFTLIPAEDTTKVTTEGLALPNLLR